MLHRGDVAQAAAAPLAEARRRILLSSPAPLPSCRAHSLQFAELDLID